MSDGRSIQVHDFRDPSRSGRAPGRVLAQTVFLVGFMGAGKTSVARKLARNAGAASVDMDTFIERRCDMKVRELFAEMGEGAFREIETEVLREFAEGEPLIVSCGGGVVLSPANREILKRGGYVVYLKVTATEAASRISNLSARPLFGDLEQAQRVIDERLPLYEEVADLAIDTAGRGTGAIARELLYRLDDAGVLVRPDKGRL